MYPISRCALPTLMLVEVTLPSKQTLGADAATELSEKGRYVGLAVLTYVMQKYDVSLHSRASRGSLKKTRPSFLAAFDISNS